MQMEEKQSDFSLTSVSDLKNKWHLVVDRLTVLFLKFLEYFHKLKLFIWWLLEMHIIKIVSTYIILLSVKEVEAPPTFPNANMNIVQYSEALSVCRVSVAGLAAELCVFDLVGVCAAI